MTEKEFNNLKVGDLIRNKYSIYVITEVKKGCYVIRPESENNWGLATEPESWTKVKQKNVIILGGQYEKRT